MKDVDAVIDWLSGPALRARVRRPFQMNEAVLVGTERLLGEVISLQSDHIVVQVYDDTSGLSPGDAVARSELPLSVKLGPGLLGGIFDGLLRPLSRDVDYVVAGLRSAGAIAFDFRPSLEVGQEVSGGAVMGEVVLEDQRTERCLIPPDVDGVVESVVGPGKHSDRDEIVVVRTPDGRRRAVEMMHRWPVREPRPVRERLPADRPMITGQRILDMLFPVARGGRAALPGGFGTGKTVLQQTLAKWSDADVVVYVGCGERGNEMAEVLEEFPELDDPRTGRRLLERTVIIANTSNMPVAAREASIYTGITVAEYFRDQGLDVALMADSTSRWAEALREISGRLGELPAEGGYPAYLSSRLADFYERAGRARVLCGKEGSVTLIGAVSPPGGDFSEPVTKHTQRYVGCLWSLDPARAHARTYPAVHPLRSYSRDTDALATWWQSNGVPDWPAQRRRLLVLLEEQEGLLRMARIVGKDALPAAQQLTLLCAELATESFLRQSALSDVDAYCGPTRQAKMLALVLRHHELASQALSRGVSVDSLRSLPTFGRLLRMSEEIGEGETSLLDELARDLEREMASLEGEVHHAR